MRGAPPCGGSDGFAVRTQRARAKRARSARGRCRFRNRNIPMVGGAGFSRCRKNPLVFRLSARRGGHGVQFFFFFPLLASFPSRASFFAGFPSSPGFPALQDSPLSSIPGRTSKKRGKQVFLITAMGVLRNDLAGLSVPGRQLNKSARACDSKFWRW